MKTIFNTFLLILFYNYVNAQEFYIGSKFDVGFGTVESKMSIDRYMESLQKNDTAVTSLGYTNNAGLFIGLGVTGIYEFNKFFSVHTEIQFLYQNFKTSFNCIKKLSSTETLNLYTKNDFDFTSVTIPLYGQFNYQSVYLYAGGFAKIPLKNTINTVLESDGIKIADVDAELENLKAGNYGLTCGIGVTTEIGFSRFMWGLRWYFGLNGSLSTNNKYYDQTIDNSIDLYSKEGQNEISNKYPEVTFRDFKSNNLVMSIIYLW